MNIPIPAPSGSLLNPHVFRAADRMRIDGCANAVAREGLSLALYCPYEALLDHYVNLLLARLRQQAPEHRIEVYFPANTDSLLDRFNEVLASQSLNQAVKALATVNQAQVWIVHDAHTLPESEVQLLARLIQNFPGANIRAVLLMSGPQSAERSPLSAFGRKILRWDIEAPTEEQAQAALEAARQDGQFSAMQQLIQRIQRQQRPELNLRHPSALLGATLSATGAQAASPADPELASPVPELDHFSALASASQAALNSPAAPAAVSPLKSQLMAFQKHGAAALQSLAAPRLRWQPARQWLGQNAKLLGGVAFALSMSTLMMLWIQPEAFGLKSTQSKAVPHKTLPLPGTPSETPAGPPATVVSPAPAATAAPSATPSKNAATLPAPAPTSPALVNPTAATAPISNAGRNAQVLDSPIETPDASVDAQTWLKKLDSGSFLLQHATANTYQSLLDIQRKYPALKDAQIVAAYRPGEKLAHFVMVSGPFSEVTQGYEAAKRPGIPRSWVRPTRSLQAQLKNPT